MTSPWTPFTVGFRQAKLNFSVLPATPLTTWGPRDTPCAVAMKAMVADLQTAVYALTRQTPAKFLAPVTTYFLASINEFLAGCAPWADDPVFSIEIVGIGFVPNSSSLTQRPIRTRKREMDKSRSLQIAPFRVDSLKLNRHLDLFRALRSSR